jgi:hypothetical protein
MTIAPEIWEQVRRRAGLVCEYCGVREADVGGLLTVDHFQPQSCGGPDDLGNLIYCCHRCNLYKADYWPAGPQDPILWNPRAEPPTNHFLTLMDGTLHPITPVGAITVRRLRLNRPALVNHRRQRQAQAEQERLLTRYHDLLTLLEQLHEQQVGLLEEHRTLLEEQRTLLRLLREGNG